jgi:radical SAM superfamily enzyme YgiQ (UPF0313 family)
MTRALLMCMPDIYQSWDETHIKGPWLGGASIAGNTPNHEVYVGDLVLKRKDVKAGVNEAINLTNPEVVGLSAMTFQYPTATRIAKYIKSKDPKIPIVLGGYHATSMREEIAKSEEGQAFDYIFAGESEHTFNEFLSGKNPGNISGLSFKDNGRWIHNQRHEAILISQGLDSINPPKRDSRIWEGYHFHSRVFDTAESSRGCDYACKFCSMRAMMPKARFSAYDQTRIINDLKSAQQNGIKSIFFCDDNPAMRPEQFKEFLREIKKEGLDNMFYSGMVSTKSMADRETTKLMRDINWDFVFLGVENIYEGNLKGMRKRSSADLAARALDSLYDARITVLAGIIAGNPDDNEETIRGNFQWFYNHPVDTIMPQFLTPYPGTDTRKELLEEGLVVNKGGMSNEYGGWTTYNGEFAHCKTRSGLMPKEIEKIAYDEYKKFSKIRGKRFLKGELNFPKNNPKHMALWILRKSIPMAIREIRERNLSLSEKSKRERQRKIAMNQFNI